MKCKETFSGEIKSAILVNITDIRKNKAFKARLSFCNTSD